MVWQGIYKNIIISWANSTTISGVDRGDEVEVEAVAVIEAVEAIEDAEDQADSGAAEVLLRYLSSLTDCLASS